MIREIPSKFNDGSFQKKIIFGIVLILLCGFFMMFLSSEKILWYDDYHNQYIKFSDIINFSNDEYNRMERHWGVSMRTEFGVYSPETKRILVYWENNSDEDLTFGESWDLFKKQGNAFIPVVRLFGGNWGFTLAGLGIRPETTVKHVYWVETYTDKLTPGTYKIKTDFHSGQGKTLKTYALEAEFTVSNDKSKWGKSALDFLNGENYGKFTQIGGIYRNTDFCLYKNKETYDIILTDGTHEYEIAKGSGKWGVTDAYTYEYDGKIYLICSYSREENGKYCSYLFALDITDNSDVKEIFKSEPFYNDDYTVGFSMKPKPPNDCYVGIDENYNWIWIQDYEFRVFLQDYKEYEGGGVGGTLINYIGFLVYENGGFFYEENTDLQ